MNGGGGTKSKIKGGKMRSRSSGASLLSLLCNVRMACLVPAAESIHESRISGRAGLRTLSLGYSACLERAVGATIVAKSC